MDWLSGLLTYKAAAKLVTYDGENFRNAAGDAISVSGSGESNTASNVGVGGIGVFNDKVGIDLQFRNIKAKSNKVAVTLNDPNDEIEVDVAEANLTLSNMGGSIDLGGAQVGGTLAAARMPAYTGDATSVAGNVALTIANDAVTNAKAANMAANTIKVNATTGIADPSDLAVGASKIVGRGPTGNIDDLTVNAGLVITDTTIGRAAITGDVSIGEDSNTSTIGAAKITTAMIQTDAVGNQRLSNMANGTVKGRGTAATGDPEDLPLLGGLTWSASGVKSKGSFSFPVTFNTTTTMSDPGADVVRFNNATLASVTQVAVSSTLGLRDVGAYLGGASNGTIGFIANSSLSDSWAVFDITTVDDNGTGDFYTLTVTPMANVGALPDSGEELQMFIWPDGGAGLTTQDVLDMLVIRRNENNQLIDELGNVISGSPTVADYAALVALTAADYDGFAVNIQSGMNNSFFSSNGTGWGPLNGQYIHARDTVPGDKVIVPANVTWAASDSGVSNGAGGNRTRLTASAAHGMTEANAEGSYLYLISGGANWTAGTKHRISPSTGYISTTVVDIDTAWVEGMGVPVFARSGTSEATSEFPLLEVSLPVLRANSGVEIVFNAEFSADVGTGQRRVKCYLGSTELNNLNITTSNVVIAPERMGFTNQGATNSQRSIFGGANNGVAVSTTAPLTAAVDTSVDGAVLSIRGMSNVDGITFCVGSYNVYIRG